MKYITTNKHPELREGIEITEYPGSTFFNLSGEDVKFSYIICKNWLDKGYIKEVEKKEFTRSDLVNLLIFDTGCEKLSIDEVVDRFIKKGYIKEVEKKEFTKSDMIEFSKYSCSIDELTFGEALVDWLEERK
jgi:ribosomal protein S8